jgi:hypothetical protein
LADLVESILAHLGEAGIKKTPLSDEWAAIQATDNEEAEFCIAAARLGLDPYTEAKKYEDEILRAADVLSEDLLGDFLDAADPQQIGASLDWVNAVSKDVEMLTAPEEGRLAAVTSSAAESTNWSTLPAWEIGWEQARTIRAALGVRDDETFDVERNIANAVRPIADRGLQALGRTEPGRSPSVILGRSSTENAKRFALARAAWHVLWRESPAFLITSAYTDRQKVERAFAAELLAPAAGIADRLGGDPATAGLDEIEDAARHFRVSPMIVQHQIENQLIASW